MAKVKFVSIDTKLRKSLNAKQIQTIYEVFNALSYIPYNKLNTMLGSLTIDEMVKLQHDVIEPFYLGKVRGYIKDSETRCWEAPYTCESESVYYDPFDDYEPFDENGIYY